jgi:hypothetical protein
LLNSIHSPVTCNIFFCSKNLNEYDLRHVGCVQEYVPGLCLHCYQCQVFSAYLYSVGWSVFCVTCTKSCDCHVNVQRHCCMLNSIHCPFTCKVFFCSQNLNEYDLLHVGCVQEYVPGLD